jgi:hypothetical protein
MREVTGHRKWFNSQSIETIDKSLREQKKAEPHRIPYSLTPSTKYPDHASLCFMPSSRMRKEYIKVSPSGFVFRKQEFTTIEKLLKWFKQHFQDPILNAATPAATVLGNPAQISGSGWGGALKSSSHVLRSTQPKQVDISTDGGTCTGAGFGASRAAPPNHECAADSRPSGGGSNSKAGGTGIWRDSSVPGSKGSAHTTGDFVKGLWQRQQW